MAGKPTGRTSKFTPALQQKIIERLQAGATIKATCESVGISATLYYRWIEIGKALAQGETHPQMPRNLVEREPFIEFLEATTRAIADSFVHASVAFRQGMNPSKTVAVTSETTEETRVNPKTGELYTYRKTISRTTTTQAPGDWRAAMEYLARRDPEEWARTNPQKVEVNGSIQVFDMNAIETEITRRIEAGELSKTDVLEIVDHDQSLAERLFANAQARVQAGET